MFNMTFTRLNVSAWLCQRTRYDGTDFIRLRLRENVLFIISGRRKYYRPYVYAYFSHSDSMLLYILFYVSCIYKIYKDTRLVFSICSFNCSIWYVNNEHYLFFFSVIAFFKEILRY